MSTSASTTVAAGLFIASLILVLAGLVQIVTNMSFGPSQEEILVPEQLLRIVPPYGLLLTSMVLSLWMPETLYRIIVDTISIIGGTIHG